MGDDYFAGFLKSELAALAIVDYLVIFFLDFKDTAIIHVEPSGTLSSGTAVYNSVVDGSDGRQVVAVGDMDIFKLVTPEHVVYSYLSQVKLFRLDNLRRNSLMSNS